MAQAEKTQNDLRLYRQISGYQQKDVARLLGIKNTSEICRWEKGINTPNILNLLKLSILYKAPVEFFYRDLQQKLKDEMQEKRYFSAAPLIR